MASIREQAVLAVVSALEGTGTPAESVFRSRLDQIEQGQLPCFDVSPGEEKITSQDRNSVERVLSVNVRALIDAAVEQTDTDDPGIVLDDSGLDPYYIFAVQALTGGTSNLGGVVTDVEETSNRTVFQPEGREILGLEMTFDVYFSTKRGDPTRKG